MERPPVDVVVPFAGDEAGLAALRGRLPELRLGPGDSVVVAHNRPDAAAREPVDGLPAVVAATGEGSPPHARNRGAAAGSAEWILFVDSDVDFPADHVDRMFDPAPADTTGVLAGGVLDLPPGPGHDTRAIRYAHRRGVMHHDSTLRHGHWAFAQTANCAVRRRAFEAAGGFQEGVFMGEDADLCYRLRDAGWAMELRTAAAVVHHNRPGLRGMLRQMAIHGAANRWMQERWPGCTPQPRWPGLALWSVRHFAAGAAHRAAGDREEGAAEMLDPFAIWAFELGRLRRNEPRWRGPAAR